MLQDLGQLAQRRYEKGRQEGLDALRQAAMIVLVSRFDVDEEQWQPRLASLDFQQLNDLIRRASQASSEAEL